MASPHARRYKDTTLQQVRSFCEAARLGSLSAAAEALGLTHPTVWKQVHALERTLGVMLFDTAGRKCRLTPAGRELLALAAPAVGTLAGLKAALAERLGQTRPRLAIAASPRVLTEDLLPCLTEFRQARPDVAVGLIERLTMDVVGEVVTGRAEVGFLVDNGSRDEAEPVEWEPAYAADLVLITPAAHPLARKPAVTPKDLLPYRVVNTMDPRLWDRHVYAAFVRNGIVGLQHDVDSQFTVTIRKLVEAGFGIGFSPGPPVRHPHGLLAERSMAKHFGRPQVYAVWRRGAPRSAVAEAFVALVRRHHAPGRGAAGEG